MVLLFKASLLGLTIADWLYKGIVTDRLVLSIDRSYFQLSGGIERWLYRLIRRYSTANTQGYVLPLRFLHETSGTTQRYADFAKELRRTIARQRLPGYWLDLRTQEGVGEVLYFVAREHLAPALPAPEVEANGRKRRKAPAPAHACRLHSFTLGVPPLRHTCWLSSAGLAACAKAKAAWL